MPLQTLKSRFKQPQEMLALNPHFCRLCIEVALIFPQVGIVALLNAGTRTDDAENAKSPSRYSLLLKYSLLDKYTSQIAHTC